MAKKHKRRAIPYRQRQILDLIARGVLTPSAIARRMKITPEHARVMLCKMRKAGLDVPYNKNGVPVMGHPLSVIIPNQMHLVLQQQATERGLSADALVRKMLLTIIEDQLFDAVIDTEADNGA